MATRLASRSDDKLSARSRSTERTESAVSRSTSRSYSSSTSRSTSRSVSATSTRSNSSGSDSGSSTGRSVGTSASSKTSTLRSRSRNTTPSTRRSRSAESGETRGESRGEYAMNNTVRSPYNSSGAVRWKKKEPSFQPRYPQNGLNAVKIEGVRRDTFNYYIHRRKIAEVKSRVDNRPPQIYPHVYYDMKKLRKRQEEQAMIQSNNHRLLSKLVVAMTTTRIDNVPKNRDSYMRNKQKDHRRLERLIGSNQSSRHSNSFPRFAD